MADLHRDPRVTVERVLTVHVLACGRCRIAHSKGSCVCSVRLYMHAFTDRFGAVTHSSVQECMQAVHEATTDSSKHECMP